MFCGVDCGQRCGGQAVQAGDSLVPPPGLMLAGILIYGVPLLVLCLIVGIAAHWPPLVALVVLSAAMGLTLTVMRQIRPRLEMLSAHSRIHLRRKNLYEN